jgi:hypothetical protein
MGLLFFPQLMSMENHDGVMLIGVNQRTRRKTYPNATFFTTNLAWTDPGANPDLRGESSETNRLSYGTAYCTM